MFATFDTLTNEEGNERFVWSIDVQNDGFALTTIYGHYVTFNYDATL